MEAWLSNMPKRPCPTHKPLRILLGHLAPSTGVEAGDVLPVRHHLRALHLHRRQRQPYEELPNVYWQRRTFQVFSCPTIFYDFFLRFDVSDFYANPGPTGLEFKGPLWSPFRAMYNLTTWNMFISVPLFYRAIFKFRRGQELMPGDYRKLTLHCMLPLCYITSTTRHL